MNEYIQVDGRRNGQNVSVFKLKGTSKKLLKVTKLEIT